MGVGVEKIVLEGDRAAGFLFRQDHDMPERSFDAIITTTPSYILPRLVPSMPDHYVQQILDPEGASPQGRRSSACDSSKFFG